MIGPTPKGESQPQESFSVIGPTPKGDPHPLEAFSLWGEVKSLSELLMVEQQSRRMQGKDTLADAQSLARRITQVRFLRAPSPTILWGIHP